MKANQASRLCSGSLTSSRLLQHAGMGVQFSQLINDFGRTRNLVTSAQLREKAKQADVNATREDIVLATDQVFFQGIQAQATPYGASQYFVSSWYGAVGLNINVPIFNGFR